jgi:two-component system, cell cycle sensor histidine kinase and response regulator CckA
MRSIIPDRPVRWPWFLLFILACLALLIVGYTYYQSEAERIRQEKYQELAAVGKLKADQIKEWRDERLRDLVGFTDAPFFKKGLQEWLQNRNNNLFQKELQHSLILEKENYGYTDVILLDIDGRILLSAQDRSDTLGPIERRVIETALAKRTAVLGDLRRSSQGIAELDAAVPIFADVRQPIAVLVMKTNAASLLYPLIKSWPTPSRTAETLLVSKDGDKVLFLNDLRHRPNSALSFERPLTLNDLPAAQAVLGKQGIFRGKDYREVDVLADLRPIPQSPWFIVAKVDASEILAEIRYRGGVIAFFATLFVVLSGGMTAYGYRHRQAGLYKNLYQMEREQREVQDQFRTTLYSIGDAVITTDTGGLVKQMNPLAESLTGCSEQEAKGQPIEKVLHMVNEESRKPVENPKQKVLGEGVVVGLANHTLLIARDGTEHPIADSAAPIRDESGVITGLVLVFRDQTREREAAQQLAQANANLERRVIDRTAELELANERLILEIEERKRSESIMLARLRLLKYASSHSLGELLQDTLDEAEALTDSVIGFYHFVDEDQKTLWLQAWSTRTLGQMCTAEGKGLHYDLDKAGVWVDCVHEQKPVIHNDYSALPHRRGMPTGHAEVIRELVVPVFRGDRLVAILGVGNKPVDYDASDIETVSLLADLAWDISERKRAEEALRASEERHVAELEQRIKERTSDLVVANEQLMNEINEREQAESDLQRSNAELQQFAYVASHDLQEPLRMISSYMQLLERRYKNQLDHDADEFIAYAVDGAKRMQGLIIDLLQLSRLGTRERSIGAVDCEEILKQALGNLQASIAECCAQVTHEPLPTLTADATQLVQLFQNLIGNAVKFRGTETPRIHVSAEPMNGKCLFSVRDNGIGIDPEHSERIFGIFQRLHGRDEYPGTGIGLAICKKIVERHDGQIWVESEPGQGATFFFTIP